MVSPSFCAVVSLWFCCGVSCGAGDAPLLMFAVVVSPYGYDGGVFSPCLFLCHFVEVLFVFPAGVPLFLH